MPPCAVTTPMRSCQQQLPRPLACASSIGISPRQSSGRGRIGEAERCTWFHQRTSGGIIDPGTHRTLDYVHIHVRDLMKLPGRVKIGPPGTITGGERR